ncbi:F0F1 ATP synthase subunit gamma [Methylomonas sp. AM2-LC]|uniref:F0F1 ATP synthase subunit gamma n=1 Tax=Methylomonas sp. AM2-LC TaxID=3153301 RepID=UPI0032669376
MSDSTAGLRRKINSAKDLQSVVRTMKALAGSSISQYEQSVHALEDYYRTIELGLAACFIGRTPFILGDDQKHKINVSGAIVFGSDQGLVGQFNEVLADYVINALSKLPGKYLLWAVGERMQARLLDAGLQVTGLFNVPSSVNAIQPLIGQIQIETEAHKVFGEFANFYVFHNHPNSGVLYQPVSQQLLPLDAHWQQELSQIRWPTNNLPEVILGNDTLRELIREYLFISLYRACAESLSSENASRLAAMERADRNIDELLANLNGAFHRLRQSAIDEELFDVISGYEALSVKLPPKKSLFLDN